MIGKLFAQEFVTTRKPLLVTQGILMLLIAVSFGMALLGTRVLGAPLLGELGFGAGVMALVIYLPAVLVLLVMNYWKTMYGQQGYFTMAIPVRGRTLFWAKTLYALGVTLVALVIVIAGVLAAFATFAQLQGVSVSELWALGPGLISAPVLWGAVGAIVLQLVFSVISGAALMSIGAQGRFNHLGFAAPVIGVVVLYFVMQILGLAAMLFVPFGVRLTGPDAGTLVAEGMFNGFVDAIADPGSQPDVLGLGIIFVIIIVGALLGWAGARSVDRRTSLL